MRQGAASLSGDGLSLTAKHPYAFPSCTSVPVGWVPMGWVLLDNTGGHWMVLVGTEQCHQPSPVPAERTGCSAATWPCQ